jgi:hypothetical protein
MKLPENFTRAQPALTFGRGHTEVLFDRGFNTRSIPNIRVVRSDANLEFLRVSRQVGIAEGWAYAALGACALPAIVAAFVRATL